jgi:hypothetical protein
MLVYQRVSGKNEDLKPPENGVIYGQLF